MSKVRVFNKAAQRAKELDRNTSRNVEAAATHLQGELKRTLRGQRSGTRYPVAPGSSTTYRASAPGEPPAVATGRLLNSIAVARGGRKRWLVGTPLKYGKHLEMGTVHMRPRPWFRKTGREQRDAVRRILDRQVMR